MSNNHVRKLIVIKNLGDMAILFHLFSYLAGLFIPLTVPFPSPDSGSRNKERSEQTISAPAHMNKIGRQPTCRMLSMRIVLLQLIDDKWKSCCTTEVPAG